MPRKPKYEPFTGEVMDHSTALLQAIAALDVAANLAVESRDAGTVAAVAQGWIEIAKQLGAPPSEEDECEEHGAGESETELNVVTRVPVGFTIVEED